jgi:histidyl-tRNA synthetase
MGSQTTIPKGTRDFGPVEMSRRNLIFDTIRSVFRIYGYRQIETPAMENLSTLLGKYGEEGDRLLFRILNSGDFLNQKGEVLPNEITSQELAPLISDKGLRYDLTVPFARFVVQHRNEITFPFRRFQIQPVWRADKPQKGRYREFYQCDADIIGSDSLFNEYELIRIIDEVFGRLGISSVIRINNRKILSGIASIIGEEERITDITIAIDKIEKIGVEAVKRELIDRGISADAVSGLEPILNLSGDNYSKLSELESILQDSPAGLKGIEEMREIFSLLETSPVKSRVMVDLTLARGLNYYTGAIIEVKAEDLVIGSICGGGRYDDLTGIFGLPGVSGVGISFGADRIYDVMSALNLFSEDIDVTSRVLFINFGGEEEKYAISLLEKIRAAGIPAEIYPGSVRIKKQMVYANALSVPWVVMAGGEERESGMVTLKNMISGEQEKVAASDLINRLTNA